jgi:hypothetical protein
LIDGGAVPHTTSTVRSLGRDRVLDLGADEDVEQAMLRVDRWELEAVRSHLLGPVRPDRTSAGRR